VRLKKRTARFFFGETGSAGPDGGVQQGWEASQIAGVDGNGVGLGGLSARGHFG